MLTEDKLDEIESQARRRPPPWADETWRTVIGLTPDTALQLVAIARAAMKWATYRCEGRCGGFHAQDCRDGQSAVDSLLIAVLKGTP